MKKKPVIFSSLGVLILLFGAGLWVHHLEEPVFYSKEGAGKGMENNSSENVDFRPASNPTYKKVCGECHFPYPPGLLPAASWKSIGERIENHFGEQVSVDPKFREEILNYLMENGADRAGSPKSPKIMDSLNGQILMRITTIPIFQKKHRGIKPEVLSRKTIGSLSNCPACHKTAEQGIFHEDSVKIPD